MSPSKLIAACKEDGAVIDDEASLLSEPDAALFCLNSEVLCPADRASPSSSRRRKRCRERALRHWFGGPAVVAFTIDERSGKERTPPRRSYGIAARSVPGR